MIIDSKDEEFDNEGESNDETTPIQRLEQMQDVVKPFTQLQKESSNYENLSNSIP